MLIKEVKVKKYSKVPRSNSAISVNILCAKVYLLLFKHIKVYYRDSIKGRLTFH